MVPVAEHLIGDRPAPLGWVPFPRACCWTSRAVAEGLATEPARCGWPSISWRRRGLTGACGRWRDRSFCRGAPWEERCRIVHGGRRARRRSAGTPRRNRAVGDRSVATKTRLEQSGKQSGRGQPLKPAPRSVRLGRPIALRAFQVALEDTVGKDKCSARAAGSLQALALSVKWMTTICARLWRMQRAKLRATFRAEWLGRPGIPPEFRAMYAPARADCGRAAPFLGYVKNTAPGSGGN